MMAIAGSDLSGIPNFEKINRAVEEFKKLNIGDLRTEFLSALKYVNASEAISFEEYKNLVCNYVPIAGAINSPVFSFTPTQELQELNIFQIINLLECFCTISIEVSLQALEFFGGSEYLVDKLWVERPWTTRPKIEDKDGIIVVSADVIYVSDEIQKDIHGEVVELCEQLFSCVPDAQLVNSRAIFPDGSVAGYNDFEIASKSIPRGNLPTKAAVHWNRNLNWALQKRISAPNETARISALSSAIVELNAFLHDAANLFCRMDKASIKWNGMLHLRKILNEFIPMPKLSSGKKINRSDEIYTYDEMHSYVSDVQRVVEELITPPDNLRLFSSRVAELSKKSEKMLDEKLWQNTLQPPLKHIGEIKDILLDIRAVLGDAIIDNDRLRKSAVDFTKMSKKHSALPKAAYAARSRMEQDKLHISHCVSSTFEKSGFKTSVYIKELGEDKGIIWPNIEIAVLIKFDELEEWYVNLADITSLSKEAKQDFIIYIAPEINNIVPPLAMKIISTEFPEPDFKKIWEKVICKEFLVSELLLKFDEIISTFTIVSAAITNRDRELNNKEVEYISNIIHKISEHFIWLESEFKNNPTDGVILAFEFINEAWTRLKSEIEEVGNKCFATEIFETFKGIDNEFGLRLSTTRLVIMDDAIRNRSLVN